MTTIDVISTNSQVIHLQSTHSEDIPAIDCAQNLAESDPHDTGAVLEITSTTVHATQPSIVADALASCDKVQNYAAEQQCLKYLRVPVGVLKQQSSHRYLGHCLFNGDIHPSLSINPAKYAWYCLSACQVGGEWWISS